MTALYIILAIAAVIALIIYIPIDAAFFASYFEKNGKATLGIKYSFIKIPILPQKEKKPKPDKEEEEKEKKEKQPLSKTIEFARETLNECFSDAVKIIKHLFTHTLQTKRFYISGKFGTGNPMMTGIAYGSANAFIYNLVSFIDRHSKLYDWKVDLQADYDNAAAEGEADIIIRTRIAYVLKLACMALILLLKIYRISRRVKKNG